MKCALPSDLYKEVILAFRRRIDEIVPANDTVLLAMYRSGFKRKSTIKGGVVMSSITGDIRRATMDMDIDFVHHSISIRSIEQFVRGLNRVTPELKTGV